MPMSDERAVAMAVAKWFGGDSPLGHGTRQAYCDETGLAPRTLHNWTGGISVPPASRVRHMARWIAERDPVQAIAFAAALLGVELSPALASRPCPNIVTRAAHLVADSGALTEMAAEFLADGRLDYTEAARLERATAPVLRGAYELQAAARAVPTPQLSIAI